MQNDKQKRLKIQQTVISVTCLAMVVFVFVWLINTAVTGRKNGLHIALAKKTRKADTSSSVKADSSAAGKTVPELVLSQPDSTAEKKDPEEERDGAYEGAALKDDFSDACFIGDSRTVGLEMNSDKPKADFYASQGLNISSALTEQVVTLDNGNMGTVIDGAAQKTYDRIFIMFGINELGWPYPETFVSEYIELVNAVKQAQPDADIYIESVLPVSYLAAETDAVFTNENIDAFNEYVKEVADRTGTHYLDVNQYFKDASGSLPEDAAADGIHFVREYCLEWIDVLAYLCPQDKEAAERIAEERSADQDTDYEEGEEDEAEGELGFVDPEGYSEGTEDEDDVVDGQGNVDYDDGQTADDYGYDDYGYDYTYENNDGYTDYYM